MGSYLEEVLDDFFDYFEDFLEHLFHTEKRFIKRSKKVSKSGENPAYDLAVRIRGAINLLVGASVIYTSFIGAISGITGVKDIINLFMETWPGRLILFSVGLAYMINGMWKLVMGKKDGSR